MTTTFEPGCYIDGRHGHYGVVEVIRMAIREHVFTVRHDNGDAHLVAFYERDYANPDYDFDGLMWLHDQAESALNEKCAVEGHWWGWNDGDFGLWQIEEDDF